MTNATTLRRGRRSWRRLTLVAVAAVIVAAGPGVGLYVRSAVKAVPGLFKRSAALKAQDYYMGEFEFKLVSVAYYLNEGSYLKAYTTFQRIRNEMETTQGVDGGFSLYTASTHGAVDGISTALGLLQATGSLPGTWERDRLWGEAIASGPQLVRKAIRGWEDAALPPTAEVNSLRIYRNTLPAGDGYDDANLLQIVYPGNSPVLDLMDLRQKTAGFLATTEQAYGNWASKEALRARFLEMNRDIKTIPVAGGNLDLARIAKDQPCLRRFCVVGYDIFQVPVVRMEFIRTGAL